MDELWNVIGGELRSVGFVVRLTPKERACLEKAARDVGANASGFLRMLLYGDSGFLRAVDTLNGRSERTATE